MSPVIKFETSNVEWNYDEESDCWITYSQGYELSVFEEKGKWRGNVHRGNQSSMSLKLGTIREAMHWAEERVRLLIA